MVKQKGVDEKFNYNESVYSNQDFIKIFSEANRKSVFHFGFISQSIMRGFKGKWKTGPEKEEAGLLQELSRLSFLDFTSHLRRAVLNFNSGMKLAGPRRLNPSQYGYFCTNETPGGASIGITKNLSILAGISTSTDPAPVIEWLYSKGGVMTCDQVTSSILAAPMVATVYVNGGIVGYTLRALALRDVLKALKWTGCLPATAGV
jgi:DNA-directed RNA polymerase III subunit RPC2